MISLFEHIRDDFDRTNTWDQSIFSDWILAHEESNDSLGLCGKPYDVEQLSLKSFVNMMYNKPDDPAERVAAHATCIEGSTTKLFAVRTLYGSPIIDDYSTMKTISIDTDINVDETTIEVINSWMRSLAYIAKDTGRAIRVPFKESKWNIWHEYAPFRVVSADFLHSMGVNVVEPQFWSRALTQVGREKKEVKLSNFSLSRMSELKDQEEYTSADELQFSMNDMMTLTSDTFGGDEENGTWSRDITCRRYSKSKPKGVPCLKICDTEHF